jgi:anti-sigma regulatory factor (Ser/Thr protein kinase)
MLERLDRAFTSQRQFIANASHELRTPLTLMRTAIDVVLAKPEPTRDELLSMAADVRHAVDHSERLIEVLLVLARNDQARTLTDPLDLAAVAEDALEGRAANGVTTITTLDEAPVTGDGMLLERLVANLLDNAERYNVAGGTVTISTTTEDGVSLVRVVNTGPVVPPGQVDRLFLPFTRLDDRTRHDGFGLGLALVSSIATVHGGTVHANANPGGGLDITVRLPRRYRGEWEVEVPLGGRCRAGPRTTGSSLLSGGLRGDPEPHQTKLIRIETAARPALAAAGAAFLRERLVPSWLAYLTLGGVPLGLLDALSFGGSPFEPIGLLGLFYFLFWSLATGTSLLFRPSVSMRPTEQPAVA